MFDPDLDASDQEIRILLALVKKRHPKNKPPSIEKLRRIIEEDKARKWLAKVGRRPEE